MEINVHQYLKNGWQLIDNYGLSRLMKRPSTAAFWYLPEPSNLKTHADLERYKNAPLSPFYLLDYRKKLQYQLTNRDKIMVLAYPKPLGERINPEAAFQYALGLHDCYLTTGENSKFSAFFHYAEYFLNLQNKKGLWPYLFDWHGSKSPWYSALAQARGASVMLRAFKLNGDPRFQQAAKQALTQFTIPTNEGGFLHPFQNTNAYYYEEYPQTPTAVLNGFMSCIMNIWEINYWLKEEWIHKLWQVGISSLEDMLPHYTTGWWSIYDLDRLTPITNVNSPRYHLLEIDYLQILSLLSNSKVITEAYYERIRQYKNPLSRLRALTLKSFRKICYK